MFIFTWMSDRFTFMLTHIHFIFAINLCIQKQTIYYTQFFSFYEWQTVLWMNSYNLRLVLAKVISQISWWGSCRKFCYFILMSDIWWQCIKDDFIPTSIALCMWARKYRYYIICIEVKSTIQLLAVLLFEIIYAPQWRHHNDQWRHHNDQWRHHNETITKVQFYY
jgi:hypothetical protein